MAQQITIKGTSVTAASELLVADSNSKIPAVDGSQVTAMSGTNVSTGTIATARLDTGTTANKIVVLDGTAKLPAVDGSLLTGLVSYTKSASDPTISTNPSGGVGTEWVNTTSGKQYICTDATAGENVWSSSGSHSGDIIPYVFQGSNYGYATCGWNGSAGNYIDKWSFSSDGNATAVGDMTVNAADCGGVSSTTFGYNLGGTTNVIDKVSFSADGNGTDVGDLLAVRQAPIGTHTESWGYSSGGYPSTDNIEKISFVTDSNSVDQGNLTVGRSFAAGASSLTYGYVAGGQNPASDVIDKHAFANSNNAVDVGNLVHGAYHSRAGTSSTTYGYSHGGYPTTNNIEKWSFSSDGNSADVANLTRDPLQSNGTSSTTHGYAAGGSAAWSLASRGSATAAIDKYSYASDVNASSVGNLTQTRSGAGGHQY